MYEKILMGRRHSFRRPHAARRLLITVVTHQHQTHYLLPTISSAMKGKHYTLACWHLKAVFMDWLQGMIGTWLSGW